MSIAKILKFRIRTDGAVSIVGLEVPPQWHSSTIRGHNEQVTGTPCQHDRYSNTGSAITKHEKQKIRHHAVVEHASY
jgi:hypothetical protein